MGGFECSTQRLSIESPSPLAGARRDMIAATQHDIFAFEDYQRLHDVQIRTARDGVRWHLIETKPGRYDFESLLPMLQAAHQNGIQVIWDLFHYGWPDDLDIWGSHFVERFARFAHRTAEVILQETGSPIFVTPVNEVSFVAWGGGDAGYLNPFARGRGVELKRQLVRAAVAATEAVRAVDRNARICHIEPIIHIAAHPDFPEDISDAERYRQSQFEAWDMIAGRIYPELGGRSDYLDIIGVNYYANNQWIHRDEQRNQTRPRPHQILPPGHPLHRPVHEMLGEVSARYERPLFIAETGTEAEPRSAWLQYVGQEARAALAAGVPLHGLCLYPIVNHPGWDDNRHCYNGLWDYAAADSTRPVFEPLAREIRRQQELLDDFLRDGILPPREPIDLTALGEASRQMESADLHARWA